MTLCLELPERNSANKKQHIPPSFAVKLAANATMSMLQLLTPRVFKLSIAISASLLALETIPGQIMLCASLCMTISEKQKHQTSI